MKEGIHPKYEQTTIRCACGAVIETGSTKKDIKVEICSKCHPFQQEIWSEVSDLARTASVRAFFVPAKNEEITLNYGTIL